MFIGTSSLRSRFCAPSSLEVNSRMDFGFDANYLALLSRLHMTATPECITLQSERTLGGEVWTCQSCRCRCTSTGAVNAGARFSLQFYLHSFDERPFDNLTVYTQLPGLNIT